jgi:hypothetical protein
MTKRTIGRSAGEDGELLLLALLEQLHTDRAAGLHRNLTAYCVANPELTDAFLELALATDWDEYEEITAITRAAGDVPLSPGVRKALASIPEFSQVPADPPEATSGSLQRRRVAEKKSTYQARRPGKRSDA